MKRCVVFVAAFFAASVGAHAAALEPVDIKTRSLEKFRSRADDADRLRFLGGLVLSGHPSINGLSGIALSGDRLLGVTDKGWWFSARPQLDGERLVGLEDVRAGRRLLPSGDLPATKVEGDAEALIVAGNDAWVLVESTPTLLHYRLTEAPNGGVQATTDAGLPDAAPPRAEPLPRAANGRPYNQSEAMVFLPDGELAVFAEAPTGADGPLLGSTTKGQRLQVNSRMPWHLTAAEVLPGGDALLLERRYEGGLQIGMRMRRVGRDRLESGQIWDGPILIEASFKDEIDNMEGLAAEVVDGRIVVTLASDDNASWLQRALLLRFEVSDPTPRPNPRRISWSKAEASTLSRRHAAERG